MQMVKLLIVQPYIPEYRVPFFRELRKQLADRDVQMRIAAPVPSNFDSLRRDASVDLSPDYLLESKSLTLGNKIVHLRFLGKALRDFKPDLIVAEQAVKNLELYPLLLRKLLGKKWDLGLWGQGRAFSTPQGNFGAHIKGKLTNSAGWFFAYTNQGAQYVTEHGFDPDRVTVLNNSTDVLQLRADLMDITQGEIDRFKREFGLSPGLTGVFIGGIDSRKGIDFLLDTVAKVELDFPEFQVLFVGEGADTVKVDAYERSGGHVKHLGRLQGREKALALKCSDFMVVPQWVGLVALDSLVSGCPIITTRDSSHSPEFSYLTADKTCLISDPDVESYAESIKWAINNPSKLREMSDQGRLDSKQYSIQSMAESFTNGVQAWINSPTRGFR